MEVITETASLAKVTLGESDSIVVKLYAYEYEFEINKENKIEDISTITPGLVKKITLDKTDVFLTMGKTAQLTARVKPSNAINTEVTWTSSNTSIATVDETGLITPVAVGTCTITCTAADESGKTATCSVEVSNAIGLSTVDDVRNIKTTGNYILLNDIDFEGVDWTPLLHLVNFNGTLDGKGYSIKHLNAPLFENIAEATIKNIKFEDINITKSYTTWQPVGAIAVNSNEKSTIEKIGVTGNINYSDGGGAGLIGSAQNKTDSISNCYVRVNRNSSNGYDLGGIAGCRSYNGFGVTNCYFSGTITNFNQNNRSGAILSESTSTITNCYYNKTLLPNFTRANAGTGLTTEEFADASNFNDWDFENIWIMKDGYPELRVFVK